MDETTSQPNSKDLPELPKEVCKIIQPPVLTLLMEVRMDSDAIARAMGVAPDTESRAEKIKSSDKCQTLDLHDPRDGGEFD